MNEKVLSSILDSKHIVTTLKKVYDIKLVECDEYILVYYYEDRKVKNNKEDGDLKLTKHSSSKKCVNENKENVIEQRSIIRSKLECQRIAKANMSYWRTFITLTFSDNITDINHANKRFRMFIDKIKRVFKEFRYLCVTEFQKRGATHYHLLTNIDINSNLFYTQEDNIAFKHIKYWNDGFSSVEVLENDPKKVIGYIAKYMTKDIDNRLFNRHRYFYSRNLKVPKKEYINIYDSKEMDYYIKKTQDTKLIYQNEYINPYDKTKVVFFEYIKNK